MSINQLLGDVLIIASCYRNDPSHRRMSVFGLSDSIIRLGVSVGLRYTSYFTFIRPIFPFNHFILYLVFSSDSVKFVICYALGVCGYRNFLPDPYPQL